MFGTALDKADKADLGATWFSSEFTLAWVLTGLGTLLNI